MEVRSFPALLSAFIQHKKTCEQKFTLDCLLMEVAGANVVGRFSFALERSGLPRHGFHVAQLFSLGRLRAMNLFPHSEDDRRRFMYFPFRAYVLLAFACVKIVESQMPRHGNMSAEGILFLIFGYIVCFLVFLAGSVTQFSARRTEEAVTNLLFLGLTVLFGGYLLRFLAA